MVDIPQNIKRISSKLASESFAKSFVNRKTLKPLTQSQLKKIGKGTLIAQHPSGSISRQQYEKLRKDLVKKGDLKINQDKEKSVLKKESERLEAERKKANIAYVRKEEGKKRGELMAKRLDWIKGGRAGQKEGKEFFEERIEAIKNSFSRRNLPEENPENQKDENEDEDKPKPPPKPDFVEPPDIFL